MCHFETTSCSFGKVASRDPRPCLHRTAEIRIRTKLTLRGGGCFEQWSETSDVIFGLIRCPSAIDNRCPERQRHQVTYITKRPKLALFFILQTSRSDRRFGAIECKQN